MSSYFLICQYKIRLHLGHDQLYAMSFNNSVVNKQLKCDLDLRGRDTSLARDTSIVTECRTGVKVF